MVDLSLKKSFKSSALVFIALMGLSLSHTTMARIDDSETHIEITDTTSIEDHSGLECLDHLADGVNGELKAHEINLDFTGRLAVGDLNADTNLDFVVSNRDKLAAYDLCGNQLWQVDASTNWDYPNHVFWNWTSYGYIGDADGDGIGEFLHIGADWQTLFVRDGKSGAIEHEIDLSTDTAWMYVLLGRRVEDNDSASTRIFVAARPHDNKVKAIDIRSGKPEIEWYFADGNIQNAYMPPIVVNLDQMGGDEIVHASLALNEQGEQIWRHNFSQFSQLSAAHTLTVKDIDPDQPGLEATYSIYGPKRGQPSIVSLAVANPELINWAANSPHRERHPHQHTVGDFVVNRQGLETLVRNNDAKNHWLVDAKGNVIQSQMRLVASAFPHGWYSGELVQAIYWDKEPGAEVLYTERHVDFNEVPRLVITSSSQPVKTKTDFFHGGIHIPRFDDDPALFVKPDPGSWFGFVNRPARYQNDGPYEGAAHAMDIFGDGREEVLTWAAKKIVIYYNSGDAGIEPRRKNAEYLNRKKLWTNVYNPR